MADSLTVGTDTYILAGAAHELLLKYPATDAFTGAVELEQEAALRLAFERLEALRWKGNPTSDSQGCQWPRIYLYDINGAAIDSATMPDFLTAAQCWEALAIRQRAEDAGAVIREGLQRQGVTRAKFGDVEEEYGGRVRFAGLESEQAYRLIRNYLNRAPVMGNFFG